MAAALSAIRASSPFLYPRSFGQSLRGDPDCKCTTSASCMVPRSDLELVSSALPFTSANISRNLRQTCMRGKQGMGERCVQTCKASGDREGGLTSSVGVRGRRKVEKVLTATKVGDGGAVRIIGPGTDLPEGFGPFLTLDEFFLAPSQALSSPTPPGLVESLVYFLEEPQPESSLSNHPADNLPNPPETSDEIDQPRHGLQLFFRSVFQSVGATGGGESGLHWPVVNHGREAAFVPEAKGDRSARVRLVAGVYGGVSSGPPLDRFQMLDIAMGPDSHLEIPVSSDGGALVYILEGVGLFGGETTGFASASYQNEGHALWLPAPSSLPQNGGDWDLLSVRTNKMSGLRFIFVSDKPLVQ